MLTFDVCTNVRDCLAGRDVALLRTVVWLGVYSLFPVCLIPRGRIKMNECLLQCQQESRHGMSDAVAMESTGAILFTLCTQGTALRPRVSHLPSHIL